MSYSPASIVASGALPNLVAIHYEREAVPNLKAQTPFLSMTKQRPLPLRQGNQIQFYTYALLAANLNQAAEGTVFPLKSRTCGPKTRPNPSSPVLALAA